MSNVYFEILRSGINSSIQDKGRNHLYHIGITISGAMDQRIFKLSNALVNNNLNECKRAKKQFGKRLIYFNTTSNNS